MQSEYLLLFALVFLIDSVIPGPAVAMVMSRGATVGLRRTIPFVAGLVIGDIFLFLCALLGVVVLLKTFAPLFVFLKWLGICYLLYLAFKLWNSEHSIELTEPESTDSLKTFGLGLVLPLANPRAVGFYVAVLPSFLDISKVNTLTAVQFCAVIVVVWGGTLATFTFLAARGARYVKNPRTRVWLNRSAAGAMAGAAGTIAVRQ
ncbi:MAG: LysE family translocator [Acidiferrobacterales bacterium]|nr:LysE family translocator [Acidiferrobacterales bacterium]